LADCDARTFVSQRVKPPSGVTRPGLSELVNGKRGISPEMAVRLSKVFGGAEEGWLLQQAQYDLAHVRRSRIKVKRLNPG
jgi:plasmid maintenance system antidote protein VapI